MPTLVRSSGDEAFRRASFRSMDPNCYFPLLPRIEVLCPPRKRLRGNPPASLWEQKPSQPKPSVSLDILPEECLFEIFRRLPSGRDRGSCACVSKRWLMLQSLLRRTEFKKENSVQSENDAYPQNSENDSDKLNEDDGSDVMEIDEQESSNAVGDLSRCLEGKKATDIRLAAISVATGSRWGLGKLKIKGSNPQRGVTDVGLTAISRGCPSLRVLSLWDCTNVTDNGLAAIAKGCPLLEKLDLLNCPMITDAGLEIIAKKCPKLSTVVIESCPFIGNKSLAAFGQFSSMLEYVSVTNCHLVSDEGIVSLVSAASKLAKLKLQGLGISDISLMAVGKYCTNLVDLVLTNLWIVTQKGFQALGSAAAMQKLKVLSVSFCKGLSDRSMDSISQGCPSLKQASFRKCDVSDHGLKAFTEVAVSLESLFLEECNAISYFGLVDALGCCAGKLKALTVVKCLGIKEFGHFEGMPLALATPCETLKTLNIRSCPGFGNGCLATMGMACPLVQSLDFAGLAGISDEGLLSFMGKLKTSLVKLNLSGCIEITDRAIFVIANLFGLSLQSLNFEGCRKLTDQGLKFIADCCPNLQELDMSKSSVTDNGLVSLAMTTKHGLQVLSLAGCPMITDQCLPFIGKMSENLHGLNLQHCNGISSKALDAFVGNLWRCDILA